MNLKVAPETATRPTIVPIVLCIDVEPDGFFIDPHRPEPWYGLEQALPVVTFIRERIATATGCTPQFTWMWRLDPQIALTYGSAAWPLERYRSLIDTFSGLGDEIGLHVHTYRPVDGSGGWVIECEDEGWVEHCVRTSVASFESILGRRPRVFSSGAHWMSNGLVRLLEELGIEVDHTILPGQAGRPMSELLASLGAANGMFPDYRHVPRHPYRPSTRDFCIEDPSRTEGLWMLPISTIPDGMPLRWQRRLRLLARRLVGRGSGLTSLVLRRGVAELKPGFNRILASSARPYFLFEIRSNVFALPAVWQRIQSSLEFILTHPESHRFRFVTPPQALELLGCTRATRPRAPQTRVA